MKIWIAYGKIYKAKHMEGLRYYHTTRGGAEKTAKHLKHLGYVNVAVWTDTLIEDEKEEEDGTARAN